MRFLVLFLIVTSLFGQAIINTGRHRATTAIPAYTGIIDIYTSGVQACASIRACGSATRGHVVLNVCNPSDAACADVSTNATTGDLALTTIGGTTCATLDNCTVKTFYDQANSMACSGPCDLTQATIAKRFTLKHNCFNTTKWCLVGVRASDIVYNSPAQASNLTQPFSMSTIVIRTASTTSQGIIMGNLGQDVQLDVSSSANTAFTYAGTILSATANDNTLHALQALLNGASSKINVDGTDTTGAAGATNLLTYLAIGGGSAGFGIDGKEGEFVWIAGDQSSHFAAAHTNQCTYFGC